MVSDPCTPSTRVNTHTSTCSTLKTPFHCPKPTCSSRGHKGTGRCISTSAKGCESSDTLTTLPYNLLTFKQRTLGKRGCYNHFNPIKFEHYNFTKKILILFHSITKFNLNNNHHKVSLLRNSTNFEFPQQQVNQQSIFVCFLKGTVKLLTFTIQCLGENVVRVFAERFH